jgi:hypothetical protein
MINLIQKNRPNPAQQTVSKIINGNPDNGVKTSILQPVNSMTPPFMVNSQTSILKPVNSMTPTMVAPVGIPSKPILSSLGSSNKSPFISLGIPTNPISATVPIGTKSKPINVQENEYSQINSSEDKDFVDEMDTIDYFTDSDVEIVKPKKEIDDFSKKRKSVVEEFEWVRFEGFLKG